MANNVKTIFFKVPFPHIPQDLAPQYPLEKKMYGFNSCKSKVEQLERGKITTKQSNKH